MTVLSLSRTIDRQEKYNETFGSFEQIGSVASLTLRMKYLGLQIYTNMQVEHSDPETMYDLLVIDTLISELIKVIKGVDSSQ